MNRYESSVVGALHNLKNSDASAGRLLPWWLSWLLPAACIGVAGLLAWLLP